MPLVRTVLPWPRPEARQAGRADAATRPPSVPLATVSPVMAPRRSAAGLLATLVLVVLAGCGGGASPGRTAGAEPDGLVVATTVAPITSIAAAVIGDRARVVGTVPSGRDSHTYEPPPSLARLLSSADVIFLNGLRLDEPIRKLATTNAAGDAAIVQIADEVVTPDQYRFDRSFPESAGAPNPHLWTDPSLVKAYVAVIADTMSEADPEGEGAYRANQAAFTAVIDEFDAALRTALATVPPQHRKLLTYHDSYPYFAHNYGWDVIGAVQPADFGQPSPREVAHLIDQVRAESVPAIFGSAEFPSPVIEQIGREAGVHFVGTLSDDVLPGRPGEAQHSWLGMMRQNFITIVASLGGDAAALEGFEVRSAVPDRATYPG